MPRDARRPARRGRTSRLAAAALAALLMCAPTARAGPDEEAEAMEARLEGYSKVVAYQKGGTATIWMLWGLLAVIAGGVLFKNANRSHLD